MCVCMVSCNYLFMVFEARRFHWTLGLGKYLNIQHNFSSSFPCASSFKRHTHIGRERHTKHIYIQRRKNYLFSCCCCCCCCRIRLFYSVFAFSSPLFPFQYERWGNRNSCARRTKVDVLGFCIPSIPSVYRNVVSNFNENSEQTKVDFFLLLLLFLPPPN